MKKKTYLILILVSQFLALSCWGGESIALQTPTFIREGSAYEFLVPNELAISLNALTSSSTKVGFVLMPVKVIKGGGGSWFQVTYRRKAVVGSDYQTISEAATMTAWFNLQNVAMVFERE